MIDSPLSSRKEVFFGMIRFHRILLTAGLALLLVSTAAYASPTLQQGSHGRDVLLLQQKLQSIGYALSAADGIFGQETKAAVLAFQKEQKIKVTGIVNNATWRALKNAPPRKKPVWGIEMEPPVSSKNSLLAPNNQPILEKSKVPSLIATAKSYIGVPYKFGGTTPSGFDCSGFLQFVFSKHGMNIPRLADEQYQLGLRTNSISQLVPGDLVFFTTYTSGVSHCGIYLGSGKFIHASSSKGIRIDELASEYWKPRYVGGKHIVK